MVKFLIITLSLINLISCSPWSFLKDYELEKIQEPERIHTNTENLVRNTSSPPTPSKSILKRANCRSERNSHNIRFADDTKIE